MLPQNITRITSNVLKKYPYTFDILWNKSNYLLVELNHKKIPHDKVPDYDNIPDYDLEAAIHTKIKTLFEIKEINDPRTREDKIADMNRNGYF